MQPKDTSFPQTRWTLVKVVQEGTEEEAQQALEELCKRYWYPIYAYIRRSGHPPADAEDLTQTFFHHLISHQAIQAADETRGHLRSYLLGILKRVLSDAKRHRTALMRGGAQRLLSIDDAAEVRYLREAHSQEMASPDALFDRAWAVTVLEDATAKLREAFVEGDNEAAFHHLREFLPTGDNAKSYRAVAKRMGANESGIRLQVHRMRQRYRKLIEDEVGLTVRSRDQVGEELEYLMSLIGM